MHCPSLLYMITLTILGKQYQSYSPSPCSFLQSPFTSSLLPPNIALSTQLSNTLSLCSSLNVRHQISHPHKTAGKIKSHSLCCFAWVQCNKYHLSAELLNIDMPPGKHGYTHFLWLENRQATRMMSTTTMNREMPPVITENNSNVLQSCNTHTQWQMIIKSLKCNCRQRWRHSKHCMVTCECWSLAAMCVQFLWLEAPVFWDITLHHFGWQVLTFWRIIMPSLPRLAQIKHSFAVSGTAHPRMQNCI